mmetsp:Transcript_52550/g.151483  ORF Transcript_52550/g.151483 Transcript_52550/m.151483 type:complete len:294 (+) Transcript_52550:160-1041(+)
MVINFEDTRSRMGKSPALEASSLPPASPAARRAHMLHVKREAHFNVARLRCVEDAPPINDIAADLRRAHGSPGTSSGVEVPDHGPDPIPIKLVDEPIRKTLVPENVILGRAGAMPRQPILRHEDIVARPQEEVPQQREVVLVYTPRLLLVTDVGPEVVQVAREDHTAKFRKCQRFLLHPPRQPSWPLVDDQRFLSWENLPDRGNGLLVPLAQGGAPKIPLLHEEGAGGSGWLVEELDPVARVAMRLAKVRHGPKGFQGQLSVLLGVEEDVVFPLVAPGEDIAVLTPWRGMEVQ